jgi:hypothetical protein
MKFLRITIPTFPAPNDAATFLNYMMRTVCDPVLKGEMYPINSRLKVHTVSAILIYKDCMF